MSLLTKFEVGIIEHAKAMPESGKAEDMDFEVWGHDFCEKMVSLQVLCVLLFC